MQSKFYDTIYSNLKSEFGSSAQKGQDYQPIADEFWQKLATALSKIAVDIVNEIQQNAMVLPGQQVVGVGGGVPGPVSGSTVSPGMIK